MNRWSAILPVIAIAAVTSAAAQESTEAKPPPASSSKWEWTIAPYIWGAGLSMDMQVNGDPAFGADASFSDLLDKLDVAVMLHFEARHQNLGMFTDALYVSVSDESTSGGNPPIPDGSQIDASLQMGIYELGGFWRPGGKPTGFDLLFGARLIDATPTIDVTFPGPFGQSTSVEASKSYLDGFVGVRYGVPFAGRWNFAVRGDMGAGGTQFTWNAVAGFGVRFDKAGHYNLTGGYRYMNVDFGRSTDRGVDVTSTLSLSGPFLGPVFRF